MDQGHRQSGLYGRKSTANKRENVSVPANHFPKVLVRIQPDLPIRLFGALP
jgi:hypothetical protein